jgi:OOP family OmpA-OmpF porin
MKNIKLLFASLLLVALCGTTMAQMKSKVNNKSTASGGGFKRFITKTPWTFGLSGHVVDDDGDPFGNLFNVAKTWNFMPYPTRLTIDGYYQAGISFQTEFAFTQYKSGRYINNITEPTAVSNPWSSFFSTDFHVKYDLNEVFGQTNWFDPYVTGGFGFAIRSGLPKSFTTTYNAGLGWNIWIWENLGFNMQTMAKFSMFEGTSNYLHHSVGIIYKLEGGRGSRPGKLGKRYKFVGGKTSRR